MYVWVDGWKMMGGWYMYVYTSAAYHIREAFIRAPASGRSRTYLLLHTYIHIQMNWNELKGVCMYVLTVLDHVLPLLHEALLVVAAELLLLLLHLYTYIHAQVSTYTHIQRGGV